MLGVASFLIFAVLSLLSTTHAAIGPIAELDIVNKVIAPDGFSRSTTLAGGTFPGPLIRGVKGGVFSINVVNSLHDNTMLKSTSIHWHGIFQTGTNWADGVSFVTQCPIAANHSFLYNFAVPDQAGTFWYHSHLGLQYCDGLRGPLVIYDFRDPHRSLYDVDDESTVITIGDWYHVPASQVTIPPLSDAALINGKGRYAGGPPSPLAVVTVRPGIRYRLRLVAISCDPNYVFSIDGHNFTVIETDGINTQPLPVDSIQIFAGQRYSIVLNANQPVNNYWIRTLPDVSNTLGFAGGVNSAILRYVGAPVADPTTTQSPSLHPYSEADAVPLENPGAPGAPHIGGADVLINLNLVFEAAEIKFSVNGAVFNPPTVPVLLQILSGAHSAQDLLPPGSVYTLPPNKVVEVSIPGGVLGSPHPFHLHGQKFDVVRTAGSSTYNYANPVRRDVISIGLAGDNVTFRFTTDNAGPWFLHCHIDFHLNAGMAVVFATDPDHTKQRVPVPEEWKDLCPIYDGLNPDQL
jgi:iron transport multicopper oxidase